MNLESSHERGEHELSRSTISAEANHNLTIQDNSEGEQIPNIITSVNDQEVITHQALQEGFNALRQYQASGQMVDLNRAIEYWHEALNLTPLDYPTRPALLSILGITLSDRYERTGDLADLEEAIRAFQQTLQSIPSDSPDRPSCLNNLGNALRQRYTRTGDLANLEEAIRTLQQAAQAVPSNSPDRPACLSNLSIALSYRYEHTGDLADLEAAINSSQQAVQATPPDSPGKPIRLNNLGAGLSDRYARTRNPADLKAAISVYQQAIQVISSDSPSHPGYLSNLGNALRNWYAHTGDLANLEMAFNAYQQAIQATPSGSPDRPGYLSNLGNVLRDRYVRTRGMNDLEAAIRAYQQAVEVALPNSPNRPAYLSNLGNALRDRYIRTGDLSDLEAAIRVYQQAVEVALTNSPGYAGYLSNLGNGLYDWYIHTRDLTHLEAATTVWERSWSVPHSSLAGLPVIYQLGQQRQGTGIAAHLVTGYLEQANQRHPRSLSALRRALEIAEGSKSRLLTQLVGRGSLPLPAGLSPEIAAQEQKLLAELTALDTHELATHDHFASSQEETSRFQRLKQRQTVLRELEDLWTRIAHVSPEGTAYVALRRGSALTWQELAKLAKALGPATALLSFFTTADRALLFLFRAGWHAPRVIEVPLNQNGWADLLDNLIREVHSYDPYLNDTWDRPLCPPFTRAQHYLQGVERLILSPAGPGHLLPWAVLVERAGWHTPAGQPLPLVTLPALSILPRLREHRHVLSGPALIVGDPRGNLPYAEDEARAVAKRFETEPLLGAAATKSEVLARFSEAPLIHLATHAHFDADNPLESGIELADGVLTAREILQRRLHADLLVLSACESGQVGSLGGEELAGLSQAFLQAGVRSLLVSLWKVNDPATAALMRAFYTVWQERGADKALALRQAMTQIQQDPQHTHWSDPYYWGAFVFVGDWRLTVEDSINKGEDICG
jgi:tetratricopeptide (TPR) repeat protein